MTFFRHFFKRTGKKGTTLIELLIVIGIIVIFASVTFLSLFGTRRQNDLNGASQEIAALLREARSRSIVQSSGTGWGMYYSNGIYSNGIPSPYYALFSSSSPSWTTIGYYSLPSGVRFALPFGTQAAVAFSQLNGLASASTSIRIYLQDNPAISSTINIASSGAVSY